MATSTPGQTDRTGPRGWEALLADGGIVRIRPVTPADADELRALHRAASDRSILLRYFSLNRQAADEYVNQLMQGDRDQLTLVAEVPGGVAGMVGCTRLPGTADAEVAMLVADAQQHRGVGTLLLEHLAVLARHAGIRRFVAETLTVNAAMHRVFTDAGFPLERRIDFDVTHVTIPLMPTAEAQEAIDLRERVADVASLRHVLAPRSVAVVGTGPAGGTLGGTVGGTVFDNLLAAGADGPVPYPVDPRQERVRGRRSYPSVLDLPEPVDLAVVAVPPDEVRAVIEQCGRRGVPAAAVLTGGFGAADARDLLATARGAGVRLVGPDCIGVAANGPGVRLDATSSGIRPAPGVIGVASQSGALGIGLLAEAARRRIGVSGFVSLGDKLDVSGNDLLLYWEDDPATRVIALYLESFGNPGKFLRHARRVSRRKPVIALKAGSGTAGAPAGSAQTTAAAGPDVLVSTLLRQAGVIRVRSTEELLDVAQLLGDQPVPAGDRLGVIGNSGGPGILAADAAAGAGLTVPELSAATRAALRAAAPGLVAAGNPVDLGAAAGPDSYEGAIRVLLESGEVDALVVIYAAPAGGDPPPVGTAIRRAARAAGGRTTVAVTLLGTDAGGTLTDRADNAAPLPPYAFAESAVRAVGHAARYGGWLRHPAGTAQRPSGMDVDLARTVAVRVLQERPDGGWLGSREVTELLAAVGIPLRPGGAAGAAGGAAGVELIAGVSRTDPYPPLLLVGLGGPASALLADTATRLVPLTGADAHDVVRELRSSPLLFGYRGAPPADVAAVEDLLLRVSALANEVPELAELDLDPVVAGPEGVTVVAVRARLAPVDADLLRDPLLRHLPGAGPRSLPDRPRRPQSRRREER